jgi:CubicO group peptidase (beta-lactamase class C family)/pimeloyl-ACP methyl ester carboxylesterase
VGRYLAGWLTAYNSGDIEIVRRFVAEHYDKPHLQSGPDPIDFFFVPLYSEMRTVIFNRILYANENKIIALVQSALTEAWYRIIIRAAESPPHGMYIQGVGGAQEPEDITSFKELRDADITRKLHEYFNRLAAADAFAGAILVTGNGKPIFKNAYGLADKERSEPNRIDTKFQLASLSKMFTGIGICQLAEQGKLSFTDPIIRHLPDYPNRVVAEKVTIHHLLSHTSGMGDFLQKKEYKDSEANVRTSKDYFPFFASDPLAFEPGEDQDYSNAGYIVLGAIIEKLSGQSFHDYVREHIFKPAGMLNTGYNKTAQRIPNMAIAYRNNGWNPQYQLLSNGSPILRKAVSMIGGGGSAAGGGYSTTEDLIKFELALRKNKLLSPAYTEMVLTGKGELGAPGIVPISEAYGFHNDTINEKRIVGHNGGLPGVSTRQDIYLDQEYTVVLLSNYDPPMGSIVANQIRKMLTQQARPQQPKPIGDLRTHKSFHSKFLSMDRDIVVYLPPGYNTEPAKRYPVLYLHDGQSLFGSRWRVDQTAQSLMKSGAIEPLIIVGIYNTGEYRTDEYTPTYAPFIGAGGKADLYGRMLVEELKPFIDSHYRTLTDAANTGLGGSSHGGLVTLYLGVKYPASFGKLAVLSPSVWWNNKVIITSVQTLGSKPHLRIWMDCGTAEGVQMKNDLRLLRDALVTKGWDLDSDLKYVEVKGAVHDHDAWAQRVGPFLKYLFHKE